MLTDVSKQSGKVRDEFPRKGKTNRARMSQFRAVASG
jgi:hypothetical protein